MTFHIINPFIKSGLIPFNFSHRCMNSAELWTKEKGERARSRRQRASIFFWVYGLEVGIWKIYFVYSIISGSLSFLNMQLDNQTSFWCFLKPRYYLRLSLSEVFLQHVVRQTLIPKDWYLSHVNQYSTDAFYLGISFSTQRHQFPVLLW